MRSPIRYVVFISIFVIANLEAFGQGWQYSQHLAVTKKSEIRGLTIDKDSNLYVTAFYRDAVTYSGPFGSVVYPTKGKQDILLVKLSANGDTLWHKTIGGTDSDYPQNVALDNSWNPYIAGMYRKADITVQSTVLTADNGYDIFLAKYTASGGNVFARRIAHGYNNDQIDQIATDNIGNVYMLGDYADTVFFDKDTLIAQQSSTNLFLAKLSANGDFKWAKNIISNDATGNTKLLELTVASNNEIYLGGFFHGNLTVGTTTVSSRGSLYEDMVLIKVDSSGAPDWVRQGGAPDAHDRLNGIASDQYGNVYITGYFSGTANFDSTGTGLLNSSPLVSAGGFDMFMAKYNKNGTLLWKARNGDAGNDIAYGANIHENIVQFTGYFSGTVEFNKDTLKSGSTGNNDTGFFIYDSDGNPITAHSMQGNGDDRGEYIEYDQNGNTYVGGYFASDTLTIGTDKLIKASTSSHDAFVAKYKNPFTATFTTVGNISCNGNTNGKLIVTPYFGDAPYTYTWSSNVTNSIDSSAYNLDAGTYSVTITDSRSVTATNSIVLTQPSALSLSSVVTNVSCAPTDGTANNGSINITVSGGTTQGTYSYAWYALTGSGVNSSSKDQTTLTAGKYRVVVTDDNLCSLSDTFTIQQPAPIMFTGSTVTNASGGASNGAINLTVTGGNDTPPYTSYAWTNQNNTYTATTEDISNIPGDNYYVTVTDSKSCAKDSVFVVKDLSLLIATISNKTDVDCKGNSTGAATVSISGGTGPYTYNWTNSIGNPIGGDFPSISNVPKGTYYVTVTDNFDSRTANTYVQINEPSLALGATIVGTDVKCYGDSTGIADLTASGGSLPYSFNWSNGDSTEDLIGIPKGTYSVTVTDNHACVASSSVSITQPQNPININIAEVQPILCNGDASGILTATVSGGTPGYTYKWDDPGSQTNQTATNLLSGTYSVTATDINNCKATNNVQLFEPQLLSLSESHQNVSCFGQKDGVINLSVSGGTPGFNYDWSSGQIVQDIQSIPAGSYTVTVTDNNNCTNQLTVPISQPQQVTIQSITTKDASCNGSSDGQLQVSATGGIGSYSYSIDGGTNYSTSAQFNNLAAQNYTLRAKDSSNCESNDSIVTLHQPVGTTITSQKSTNVTCNGNADGTISIQATNPVGGLTFSIDGGQTFGRDSVFTNVTPGTYQIVLKDANNCTTQGSDLTVTQPQPLTVDTTITNALGDVNGAITVSASGGTAPYRYVLTIPTTDSNAVTTNGQFSDLPPGTYKVTLTDSNSCISDTINCTVLQASKAITIYNAFSPNGDGVNDVWHIGNISLYPNCTVTIFNTWGNKVFVSKGYNTPWDGKYNGKDLPAATYYYVIDLGNGNKPYTGSVTIVR